jgi:multidrug resistance efflux pump
MTRYLRQIAVWALVVLGLAGGALAFLQARAAKRIADPDAARKAGGPIPVRTDKVVESQVDQVIGATAITAPSFTANILIGASRGLKSGEPISDIYLKEVFVRDGAEVHKGQALFELEDGPYQQVLVQSKADLAYRQAELTRVQKLAAFNEEIRKLELESAKSNLDFRTQDLARRKVEYEALLRLNTSNLVAASDFQIFDAFSKYYQARFDKSEAELKLESAKKALAVGKLKDEQNVAKATNDVERAKLDVVVRIRDVDRCKIRSPLDGYVNVVSVVQLQEVSISQVLTQVFQLDPILLRLDFPQGRLDELKIGQSAEVTLDCYPQETFTGKVVRILPQANAQLRVIPVEVEVPNPKGRIKAGINGYVRVRVPKKARTVPATAVLQLEDKKMVFRIEQDEQKQARARMREVHTGHLVANGIVEVVSGVEPGDEVVIFHNFYPNARSLTTGNGYLQDDDLVDTNWRKWVRREH